MMKIDYFISDSKNEIQQFQNSTDIKARSLQEKEKPLQENEISSYSLKNLKYEYFTALVWLFKT